MSIYNHSYVTLFIIFVTPIYEYLIFRKEKNMNKDKILSLQRMSNNEANQITREAIQTALLYLMNTKNFENISISELVRKAGVSRQAFYRNYTSKEDIIIEIEENILTSFAESINNPKYENNLHLWFFDLFCFIKENQALVKILKNANLTNILFSKSPYHIEDYIGNDSKKLHYHVIGGLGAIAAICMEWFSTGMKEDCEYMADICMKYQL